MSRLPVALLLMVVLAGPVEVSAQETVDWNEGYFELAVDGIPDRPTVVALVEGSRVLLPLRPVVLLTEVPVHHEGARRILEWPPEVWRTELDPDARSVRTPDGLILATTLEWVEQDDDLFLDTSLLGRILKADVRVDMPTLTVSITSAHPFPAQLRTERELRRRVERLQAQLFDPQRYEGVPYPARTGGLAAGWSISMTETAGRRAATARPTVGAGILGGSLDLGVTGYFRNGLPAYSDDLLARYQRVFPESDRVRQVSVGTVLSGGVVARPIVGGTISNEPWVVPQYFDEAIITPAVPAGWEYEVYQGNRLVGVSSADAPTEITAPLFYGNTPVRVRMVGPAGQVRTEELVYVVPALQVPERRTRYSLGGGACDGFGCDAYGFAELGRGLTGTLTAYAGGDWIARDEGDQIRPYVRVGYAATPSLHLGLQARGSSFLRADVQHRRGRLGSVRASYARTGADGSVLGPPGWVGQASSSFFAGLLGGRWMHARLFLRGPATDRLDRWQAALATNVGLSSFEIGAESFVRSEPIFTTRAQHTLLRYLPDVLRSVSVGGGLGLGSNGIDLLEAGATAQTMRRAAIDARFRARRGLDPTFTLGVTFPSPFGFFRGRGSTGHQSSYFLGADGGLLLDPDAGAVPLLFQGVGQGGVTGEVFFDLDGDDVRGPSEPSAAGVTVSVGGRRVTTDARGRFVAWELVPYEGTTVRVEERSLDPGWSIGVPELLVRPSPNLLSPVAIPLYRAREVIGSVATAQVRPAVPGHGTFGRPLAGAGVEIVDLETGGVEVTERTFSDGVFYVAQLRAGRYRLRLADPTARALGLSVSPTIEFEVPTEAGAPIELAPLLVSHATEPVMNGR